MSLLVQGYLASGSCLSRVSSHKTSFFFVDYPDFYWFILLNCSQGTQPKLKHCRHKLKYLLRGTKNNNKRCRACLHRWIAGGRKILKCWMQPTSLSIFLLSCKCCTSPGVWSGTMQDKREKNLLFFSPHYFSKAHCKQHKRGGKHGI